MTAFSFLKSTKRRVRRDDHIEEECLEPPTCTHEEVREWLHYIGHGSDVVGNKSFLIPFLLI